MVLNNATTPRPAGGLRGAAAQRACHDREMTWSAARNASR